jgi:hypothetical protein
MAHAQPLFLVPVASRSVFAGRSSNIRIVNYDDTNRFIPVDKITREHIRDCPVLAEIHALDPTKYLAEFQGMPGLIKGVSYGYGMLVFSENLKHFTRVCSSRVSGNKIKFNYGTEEFKNERAECWEFSVKRVRVDIITKMTRQGAVEYPFILARPDEPKCPVCYDDLSGNVIACDKKHQICLPCFKLLPGNRGLKKCPLCNIQSYKDDELERYDNMLGLEVKQKSYFYLNLRGGNSFYDYRYNEALFLGMLKNSAKSNYMNLFHNMLISSFYNFYMSHNDAFSSYTFNILNQVDGNNRTYSIADDLNQPIIDYINEIDSPHIYEDVKYTDIYMGGYDDIQFYRELEVIDGNVERIREYPNQRKELLKREIYFRYKIKNTTAEEFINYFKNIFERILEPQCKNNMLYNYITIEE